MGVNYIRISYLTKNILLYPMTIVPNGKIVVPLQDENIVASLQGAYTVHLEVDHADEVEPENSQP